MVRKIFFYLLMSLFFPLNIMGGEEGHDAPKEGKEGEDSGDFLEVGPMIISIIKDGQAVAYLKILVHVSTEDKVYFPILKNILPRLRNAYVIYVSSVLGATWITGDAPDLGHIKSLLQLITNRTLGHDKVQTILVSKYFFTKVDLPKEGG